MEVLDHEPQTWILLRDGDALLFDAACNNSFVSYSWLIELDAAERATFAREGRAYLDRLARDIHMSVPILAASRSPYKGRDRSRELGDAVTSAVIASRAAGAGG